MGKSEMRSSSSSRGHTKSTLFSPHSTPINGSSEDDYVLPRPPSPAGLHRTFTPIDPDDHALPGAPPSAYQYGRGGAAVPPTPSADHYPHRSSAAARVAHPQHNHHHLPPPHPASSPFPSSSIVRASSTKHLPPATFVGSLSPNPPP